MNEFWVARDGDTALCLYDVDPHWNPEGEDGSGYYDAEEGRRSHWYLPSHTFPHLLPGQKQRVQLSVSVIGEPVTVGEIK